MTDAAPADADDAAICAVDHRTGEVFFTASYVRQLQERIAELEAAQQSKDAST